MIGSLPENKLHDQGEVCALLTIEISRTCHSGYWPTGFSTSERQAHGETEEGRKVPCDLTFLPEQGEVEGAGDSDPSLRCLRSSLSEPDRVTGCF